MRLLIADLVRRHRWRPVFFIVMVAGMFGATAAGGSPGLAFGVSMGMAFTMGPALLLRYVPRTIWYLPVARRDVWTAGWLVSTLGVTLLTTAVKLAAILVPQVRAAVSPASVVLSSVYDFTYAGVGCGLVVLAHRPQSASGRSWPRGSAAIKGVAEFTLSLGMFVGFYGNYLAPHLLPTRWSDLTPRGIAVLATALGVAGASYFHTPMPLTPANRMQRPARVKTATPRVEFGGVSGFRYLVARESAWTVMTGGSLVLGSIVIVFVAATFLQSPYGVAGLLRALLLRFDGTALPTPRGLDFVTPLIGFAVFITSLLARFPTMLRHLRVLPLSAADLTLLLVAWPVVTWLVAWMGLLTLHYIVVGDSVTKYHAPALLALIGLSAIVQAVTLRLSNVLRLFYFAVSVGIVPLLFLIDVPSPTALGVTGAGLIAAAALLNRRSLARKSTYTPIGPTLGVAPTPR